MEPTFRFNFFADTIEMTPSGKCAFQEKLQAYSQGEIRDNNP
jgi:hypothetical protein